MTEESFELVLVSGMSGAGRSTAARALEDLGWFVVDNLPPSLLPQVIAEVQADIDDARLAVVVDVRGGKIFDDLAESLQRVLDDGIDVRVLFLEAGDNELVRRFESSRRPHPLQGSGGILDGLVRERALLGDLRARADLVIDTSSLNVHDLRRKVDAAFGGDERVALRATGHVLRVQVRPAAGRRHRQRRPLPAQPLLGARAARAHRSRCRRSATTSPRCRRRASSSTGWRRWSTW